MDVKTVSESLKEKNIRASDLKFGFLGIGMMGSGILKNLLNSGHQVTIWSRTEDAVSYFLPCHLAYRHEDEKFCQQVVKE